MDLRRATSEFVTQGRELYKRLCSIEGDALTAVDLHVLRVQLQLLDRESRTRQHTLSRLEHIPPTQRGLVDSGSKIRVLLVDDHLEVRQALRSILQAYRNIEVVGEADDGDEAIVSVERVQPTVVVMDINMHRMDGVTAARLIKTLYPHVLVLGFSANTADYNVYAMKKAGACDVLNKETGMNDLYAAIERAVAAIPPN
jgi:CheY-like chemotaxis protein